MTELSINRLYFNGMLFHSLRGILSLGASCASMTVFEVQRVSEQFGSSPKIFLPNFRWARLKRLLLWTCAREVVVMNFQILGSVFFDSRIDNLPDMFQGWAGVISGRMAGYSLDSAVTQEASRCAEDFGTVNFSALPLLQESETASALIGTGLYVLHGVLRHTLANRFFAPVVLNSFAFSLLPQSLQSSTTGYRMTQCVGLAAATVLLNPLEVMKRERQLHRKQIIRVPGESGITAAMCRYYRGCWWGVAEAFAAVMVTRLTWVALEFALPDNK